MIRLLPRLGYSPTVYSPQRCLFGEAGCLERSPELTVLKPHTQTQCRFGIGLKHWQVVKLVETVSAVCSLLRISKQKQLRVFTAGVNQRYGSPLHASFKQPINNEASQ
jgi:hypothetical protein